MRELFARFKKITGGNGVDLAAQEGLSKQYVYHLIGGERHTRKSHKKLTAAMQTYIESIIKAEKSAHEKRLGELYRLHEQIEDYSREPNVWAGEGDKHV